jgi:hypothetical protein
VFGCYTTTIDKVKSILSRQRPCAKGCCCLTVSLVFMSTGKGVGPPFLKENIRITNHSRALFSREQGIFRKLFHSVLLFKIRLVCYQSVR